jgi:hypothetical protein
LFLKVRRKNFAELTQDIFILIKKMFKLWALNVNSPTEYEGNANYKQ